MAFVQPRLPPLPAVFLKFQDDFPDSSRVLRRCGSYPGYTPFELNSNSGDEASETTLLGGSAEEDPAATWPDTDEEGLLGAPWANSTLGPRSEETSEDNCSQGEAGKCCCSKAVPGLPATANGIPISHISKQVLEAPCCPTSHTSQQVMQATRPSVTSQTSTNMKQARRARAQAVRKTRRMLPAVPPEQLAHIVRSSPSTRPRRPCVQPESPKSPP
ncbi:March7 [Symbiodinium natans]|uniref:March7 protein n=1 Tax=Symbiodinium natans TaxID=878477 RepID=A0A812JV43_9DINO|nr:March7 [Symbiodinium natans]